MKNDKIGKTGRVKDYNWRQKFWIQDAISGRQWDQSAVKDPAPGRESKGARDSPRRLLEIRILKLLKHLPLILYEILK